MEFKLFGPLQAHRGDVALDLGPPKQRALLAVLLLNVNRVASIDRIVDDIWGSRPPRTVEHSIHVYVSDLRSLLSDADGVQIETRSPGYVLRADRTRIDINVFEDGVIDGLAAIRNGEMSIGSDRLRGSLALWESDPLVEFVFDEFAAAPISRLKELRFDAMEALARVLLDEGETAEARNLAREASVMEPLRESPRRLAMLALYRSGRHAEALREYGAFHDLLANELGIEPSRDLRDLEEQMLLQDPAFANHSEVKVRSGNPYRGLHAFTEDDARLYFGREEVVAEVMTRVSNFEPLIPIVGPSGSGKSSVLRAGVMAAARKEGHTAVLMEPGPLPFAELSRALADAGFGTSEVLEERLRDPEGLRAVVDGSLLIAIDQFEELYTLAAPEDAARFGEMIGASFGGSEISWVVALRADYYDRPLSMPTLASVFAESTLSLGPVSPAGIERAIIEPAKHAGRHVEPGLLAQLVADVSDSPGALPLLQFTLFELFEESDGALTLDHYEGVGGVHGALSRSADGIFDELDADSQQLVEQLFMRMVHKGHLAPSSRPALLREVLDMGADRVALQRVLEVYGDRRLITFGRDGSGAAIVEMAHEKLMTGWARLSEWIDEHSEDLEMRDELASEAREWVEANHSDDYLFRGKRLEKIAEWFDTTTLSLTQREQGFLQASVELRDRPSPPPDVVVWFEGRGDGSFGDLIGAGVDLAKAESAVEIAEYNQPFSHLADIERHVSQGTRLVLLLYLMAVESEVLRLIERYPLTRFVLIGATPADFPLRQAENVSFLTAANEELGFLAGVAGSLATTSGRIGFVGGVDTPAIRRFQAGFEQGAAQISSSCIVDSVYLTGSTDVGIDLSGFNSPTLGFAAARYLSTQGADVLFHAAGRSGWGVFRYAAHQMTTFNENMWCVGVDVDQFAELGARGVEWGLDHDKVEAMRSQILTSIVWRLDYGIRDLVAQFLSTGKVESLKSTIDNRRVGYTTTGGNVDRWADSLDGVIAEVRAAKIVVDTVAAGPSPMLLDVMWC